MDDEDAPQLAQPYRPVKHNKWTFVVLAVDLATCIAQDIADTLEATTAALGQYRQHKIHEDEFFDIVHKEQ